jgi:hypothetical protein
LPVEQDANAKPDEANLLLVGDLGKIRSGVQSLKLGEMVVLDVEGNPVQSRSQKDQ